MEQDITNIVERFEAFEERLGITLEGVFAKIDDEGTISVFGEVHPIDGTKISEDICIIASAHDDSGRMLYIDNWNLFAESFYGFEVFRIWIYHTSLPVSKIRLYPK